MTMSLSHGSLTRLKLVSKSQSVIELDIEKINLKLSGVSGMWTSWVTCNPVDLYTLTLWLLWLQHVYFNVKKFQSRETVLVAWNFHVTHKVLEFWTQSKDSLLGEFIYYGVIERPKLQTLWVTWKFHEIKKNFR